MGKECTKCKITKPTNHFGKNKIFSDGLHIYCSSCTKLIREARKEKQRAYDKDWYSKNKEKANAQSKRWHENNKSKHILQCKQWRIDNPIKAKHSRDNWRNTNMDKVLHLCAQLSLIEKQATPIWADIDNITQIYNEARELNKGSEKFHVDHIIPINSTQVCGLHCEDNLRIILAVDNLRKSNKLDE